MSVETSNRDSGFSLVELMVSIALGLVITLGVIQLYLSNKETYRTTQAYAALQEDARYLMDTLTWDIRNADSDGCTQSTGVNTSGYFESGSDRVQSDGVVDLREMAANWTIPSDASVVGWEYQGSSPGDQFDLTALEDAATDQWNNAVSGVDLPPQMNTGWMLAGSDVLLIKTARPIDMNGVSITNSGGNQVGLSDASGIEAGTVIELMAPDCHQGYRFVKGNNANATSISVDGKANVASASINDPKVNTGDALLLETQSWVYFVGQNPNTGAQGLFRQDLASPSSIDDPEMVLPGVESLQLLFGIQSGSGPVEYVSANDGAISQWSDVVSVRAGFVESSDPRIRTEPNQTSHGVLGTEITTPEDRRVRMVSDKTMTLRN